MSRTQAPTPWVGEVIALFDDALEDVAFPGIDREVLSKGQSRVDDAKAELEACQKRLEDARAELERQRADLQGLAQRAVDYAKVFAAEDPQLSARIEALPTPKRPKKKRRARSPKKKAPLADNQLALAKGGAA